MELLQAKFIIFCLWLQLGRVKGFPLCGRFAGRRRNIFVAWRPTDRLGLIQVEIYRELKMGENEISTARGGLGEAVGLEKGVYGAVRAE